jgi:hypothetical protein
LKELATLKLQVAAKLWKYLLTKLHGTTYLKRVIFTAVVLRTLNVTCTNLLSEG